jgi:hypothetical protein
LHTWLLAPFRDQQITRSDVILLTVLVALGRRT